MRRVLILFISSFVFVGVSSFVNAAERLQPFVLASENNGELAATVAEVKQKLAAAQFDVIGAYRPYKDAEVIAFTSDELKANSLKSPRGGYAAVMRVSLTQVDGKIQVAYTHPVYWSNAYRLSSDNENVFAKLKSTLGFIKTFGSGDKNLTAEDLREYHYTMMMEYFDDPSELQEFASHETAVNTIEKNLKMNKGGASQVYRLALGKDSKGREMTLFGVALGADNCSGDNYIMSRIDRSNPRHTAHLPYEMLVYGNEVEALFARFRIAISWPHLPMMQSETGATFFSIMCAPGKIEDALEEVTEK